jgi:hypothetical protein
MSLGDSARQVTNVIERGTVDADQPTQPLEALDLAVAPAAARPVSPCQPETPRVC